MIKLRSLLESGQAFWDKKKQHKDATDDPTKKYLQGRNDVTRQQRAAKLDKSRSGVKHEVRELPHVTHDDTRFFHELEGDDMPEKNEWPPERERQERDKEDWLKQTDRLTPKKEDMGPSGDPAKLSQAKEYGRRAARAGKSVGQDSAFRNFLKKNAGSVNSIQAVNAYKEGWKDARSNPVGEAEKKKPDTSFSGMVQKSLDKIKKRQEKNQALMAAYAKKTNQDPNKPVALTGLHTLGWTAKDDEKKDETIVKEMRTPWGQSDDIEDVGHGIKSVSTPSHGGYYVPRNLLNQISPEGRAMAKKWSGSEQWYEEDVAWAFVAVAFPDIIKHTGEYADANLQTAKQIVQDYSKGGKRHEESVMPKLQELLPEALLREETREQEIKRWEKEGRLDPKCKGCKEFYDDPQGPSHTFAPSHKASDRCESGKHSHCTCDTCF